MQAEERFKLSHLALKEFKNSQPDIAEEQAEMKVRRFSRWGAGGDDARVCCSGGWHHV
jgi:hypothetical protein